MERKVAAEIRMGDRVMLAAVLISGVDSLHAHVKAQDEISEIESQAQSVGHCEFFIKSSEAELSAWLPLIIAERPDIAAVEEQNEEKRA